MRLRVLVSFHYHRNTDLDEFVADLGGDVDLFADSGAYSAYSNGAVIDRQKYSDWLHKWDHLLTVKSNLDVIGDPDGGADNLTWLTAQGHTILPVFHVGEPFDVLRAMCDQGSYVALGGLVPYLAGDSHRTSLLRWLVKSHVIAEKTGTRLHGFGLTSAKLVKDLPFYSLDSSSYTFGRRFGLTYLWDAKALSVRSVLFRNQAEVRRHAHLFRLHGLDPGTLLHPEFMVSGTDHFKEDLIKVTTASIRAFRKMERTLAARHAVISPDGTEVGTKIYFAKTNSKHRDNEPFRRASQEENDA